MENKENTYCFEFTGSQIETLKTALRHAGLEFCGFRDMYKMLCEAKCNEEDIKMLKLY